MNFTTFFLVQNVFFGDKIGRHISLNTHNLLLFKNARDEQQVRRIASQMAPGRIAFLWTPIKRQPVPVMVTF